MADAAQTKYPVVPPAFSADVDTSDDSPRLVDLACPNCATTGAVDASSNDGSAVVTTCPVCNGTGHVSVFYSGKDSTGLAFKDWISSYGRYDAVNYSKDSFEVESPDLSGLSSRLDALQVCSLLVVVVLCAVLGANVFSHFWGGLSDV